MIVNESRAIELIKWISTKVGYIDLFSTISVGIFMRPTK
jgi:hypothetical protein